MRQLSFGVLALVLATGAFEGGARADEPTVIEAPPAGSAQIGYVTQSSTSYDEYRQRELKESSRRSRNALIGLSASTAVGAALLFPGLVRQCVTIRFDSFDTNDQLRCTTAGKVLVGFGWPLFIGGVTGVLISGIMFGVRKGKLRRLEDRMAYEKSRAVRWDPASSRFVF
jgi:hypothetical protein